MKKFTVHYFAIFREAAGCASETISSRAATPAELFAELAGSKRELQHYQAALVAVNDEMVDWNCKLQDGDQVLFFPPVAGG